ncbi:hypothetical protein MTO96_036672 [Rhipicephalus appendiculatus]
MTDVVLLSLLAAKAVRVPFVDDIEVNGLGVFIEGNTSDDSLDCIVGRSLVSPNLELVFVERKAGESAVPFSIDTLAALYRAEARRTTPTVATFKPPRGLITTLW